MGNNNQALIDGLRQAADFLEATPDFPEFDLQHLRLYTWSDKGKLKEAARRLGSFTKEFTDHYFALHKPINAGLEIEVLIDRESVCKKIVTRDCPDDASLLKLVEENETERKETIDASTTGD